jgi:hypothetical protein
MALVLGSLAASSAAATPHRRPAEPVITEGPRAWALATTALLTYHNGDRLDMLAPSERSDSNVAQTRGILHDWWRVDNRADLLRALEFLDRGGHRGEFQRMGLSLRNMTDAQFRALLASERKRPDRVRALTLAREHYRKYGSHSLISWDYGRYVMLCRWGYMVGYLSEAEAWSRIMPAARTIQKEFHSWTEFGEDYLAGREFWSAEEMAATGQNYRDIQRWLQRAPRSPWRRLSWGMRLE